MPVTNVASVVFTSIPSGHKAYYGDDTSNITSEIVTGATITASATSLVKWIKVVRNSDNSNLILGKDYCLKFTLVENEGYYQIQQQTSDWGIISLTVASSTFNVEICLIAEASAGTDIIIGNTTFEGVQGVKYDGVNYDTVEIDGVSYEVGGPTGPVVRNITINAYSSNSGQAFAFSVAYQDADGNLQAYYWYPTAAGSTQTWNFDALDGVFTCSVPSSGGLTVTSGEAKIESDTNSSPCFYAVRANTDVIAELKYS